MVWENNLEARNARGALGKAASLDPLWWVASILGGMWRKEKPWRCTKPGYRQCADRHLLFHLNCYLWEPTSFWKCLLFLTPKCFKCNEFCIHITFPKGHLLSTPKGIWPPFPKTVLLHTHLIQDNLVSLPISISNSQIPTQSLSQLPKSADCVLNLASQVLSLPSFWTLSIKISIEHIDCYITDPSYQTALYNQLDPICLFISAIITQQEVVPSCLRNEWMNEWTNAYLC